MIALAYFALYGLNYLLPLSASNYTTRIWAWSQAALMVTALLVAFRNRSLIKPGDILLGSALGTFSALSHSFHDPSLRQSFLEGISVWICFLGGVSLFKNMKAISVPAFQFPLAKIGLSILFGILVAIPLAVLNNLYFYMNVGAIHFQNILFSAFEASSPAIHEEIIFRFFVLALCISLTPSSASPRLRMGVALFFAVVPHSLNHLPYLFLQNPLMSLFMLAATSLLFGLPMALLQIKKNLETAIAFHWWIDFMRFLFGF